MLKFLTVLTVVLSAWYGTVLSEDSSVVKCGQEADILFIMDSSGSVGSRDFQLQVDFLSKFTSQFNLGPTRFSVIRFDSSASIIFDFDDHRDQASLANAISAITYRGGGTATSAALQLARQSAFTTGRGSRKNVPKIAIVITDGQSNDMDATAYEADELKKLGVVILSLGIGRANTVELDAMATFPEDVYQLKDFNQLVEIVNEYSSMTCEIVKLFDCSEKADVYFLVDSSSSVTPANFQKALKFASDLVMKTNSSGYHFGAATFGGTVRKLFDMNALSTQQDVSKILLAATSVGGATDTAGALSYVQTQDVFGPIRGGREDAVKILIILTDGGSSTRKDALTKAGALKGSGVHIVSVGIDSPVMAELQELASSVSASVFQTPSASVYPRVQLLASDRPCKMPSHAVREFTEACRMYNWVNGIHPHPYICTKFIECTYLKTDILDCPEFLIYNPVLQTCDYPNHGEFCYGGDGPTPTPLPPCAPSGTVEVLLMIDGSSGVSLKTYNTMLSFASNLPENFNLGPGAVQFAAMTFSDRPNELFSFNAYGPGQYKDLQHAILGAPYKGLGTNTFSALQTAQTSSFTPLGGVRPGVPQIALVFTDGKSDNPALTAQQAAALHSAGVFVVAVGSSDANRREMEAIAQTPQAVYNVYNDFNRVRDIITSYSNHGGCTPGVPDIKVCRGIQYADVIFVMDSSNSIDNPSYLKQLTYVDNVTNNFDLGQSDAQFGAVIFSTDAQVLFHLDAYSDHAALSKAIMGAPHLHTGTDTAKALNLVTDQDMFGSAHGGRYNASKVVIVMTDGRSNSQNATVIAAQRLKDAGVRVFSIGIGDSINPEELRLIASDSKSQFQVASFSALDSITQALTQEVCQYIKVPGSSSRSDSPISDDGQNYPSHYTNLCQVYQWAYGLHPNPYDCSTYVQCTAFVTIVQQCNSGLVYDPLIRICTVSARPCDDPSYYGPTVNVNKQQPVTRPSTVTPPPNYCSIHNLDDGNYPDPDFCYGFIECSNGLPSHLDCPLGLAFDSITKQCDDTHGVDCNVNANYYISLIG